MKLFGYYAWHSFINQIRKLFKTWVLIFFVVCFLLGGVIGVGVAMLEDAAPGEEDPGYTEELPEEELPPENPLSPEEAAGLTELVVGGIVLAVFVFMAVSADKNGSRIFLPADVNLLFASPMKPQSVLLFRLMTQLGVVLLSSAYLAFQIPNLVTNMGLDVWAAVGFMAAWLLALAIGKLLQILLYTVASTYDGVKKHLRKGIYGVLLLIAGGYFIYANVSGLGYYEAATAFFNHSLTRFIPFWGWLKAFCMGVLAGDILMIVLSLMASVLGGAVLVIIIWRIPADFYEDAMAKSQETAELLEVAQAEKSTGFVKRKKDRSQKLRRDGLNRGRGASVFFWRVMYNRFRFAHLGIFTKTSETYLLAAAAVGVLCRFVIVTDATLPVVLTLAVFAFFRSMGNPLAEDTSKDFFRMIPEPTGKKLFYSILGGTACCGMDLLPALVLTCVLCGSNPFILLAWALVILSVDFYATNVGAFIDLSVPVAAGKTIKQVVQIMFIYFGLLPDIGIMAVGLVFDAVPPAALGAVALNIALGSIFLALTPLFLDPKEKPVRQISDISPEEKKQARKQFSRLGWACFAIMTVMTVLQILLMNVLPDAPWAKWVYSFAPIYLVAMPVGILIMRGMPKLQPEKRSLRPLQVVKTVFIALFMMYGGNILATVLSSLIGGLFGGGPADVPIQDFITGESIWLKILVMVILAPIMEELIFRKQLIDRMAPYGGKLAVVCSAMLFGLFHGNFNQFVYASALGLVLGYVYLKTGKLRYSIGLHMGVNFLGGIVSSWLLENLDLEAMEDPERMFEVLQSPVFLAYLLFLLFVVAATVVGLVLLCRSVRKIYFEAAPLEIGKGKWRIAWINAGMLVFTGLCLLSILASFALV